MFLKQKGKLDTRGTRTADWQDNSAINDSAADEAQQSSKKFRYDTVRKCAALSVARPYLEAHSYVRYGDVKNYTEATVSDSTSYASDGNRTEVTVPYAKTFNYWVNLKNEAAVVTSLVDRATVQQADGQEVLQRSFHGSLPSFLAAFLRAGSVSDQEAAEIEQMLEEYRQSH